MDPKHQRRREEQLACDPFCSANPINYRGGRWKRLHVLDPTDADYITVEKQFNDGWKHPHKAKPSVKAIFKVVSPSHFLVAYYQYQDRVLQDLARPKPPFANEQLLFHGTNRACSLGEDRLKTYLCTLPDCNLCCVIRQSFDVGMCGTKNRFRRFGTGIYATSVSSKADDYTQNINECAAGKSRAVLLNRVIVGNPMKRRHKAVNFTAPPTGYHSVIGEPGAELNYEETVVYHNDAIRPAYLIIYNEQEQIKQIEPIKPKLKFQKVVKALFNTPLVA